MSVVVVIVLVAYLCCYFWLSLVVGVFVWFLVLPLLLLGVVIYCNALFLAYFRTLSLSVAVVVVICCCPMLSSVAVVVTDALSMRCLVVEREDVVCCVILSH